MAASSRTETIALGGAVILGALACYLVALPTESGFGAIVPILFAVPLALTLVWLKRLRWIGAAYLVLAVVAGFLAAVYASIILQSWLGVSLCIFGCTVEEAAENRGKMQIIAAVAGGVGALVPFIALRFLGPALRDRIALTAMAIALPFLALFGSIGFTQTLPGASAPMLDAETPGARLFEIFLFIVPWQLTFGAALAYLLRRHTPKARLR